MYLVLSSWDPQSVLFSGGEALCVHLRLPRPSVHKLGEKMLVIHRRQIYGEYYHLGQETMTVTPPAPQSCRDGDSSAGPVLQVQSCRSSSAGPVLELLRHFFRTWFLHSWFWPSLISWRYEAAGRLHWGTQDWWEAAAVDHVSWMDVLSDWSTGDVSANGNMIRI